MPLDEAKAADTRAWLSKAQTDIRNAEHALDAPDPFLEDTAFHCQQAVEKALKALLTWHDVPFRRTHSIEEIGRQCVQIDFSLEPLVDQAAPLTEYAWQFRYPGDPVSPAESEAEQALEQARSIYDAVIERLPEEVRL